MIVDSSAMVAMLRGEPEARAFFGALTDEGTAGISAANYLETAIVLDGKRDPVVSARLDTLLARLNVVIEPVTATQARIARQAYRDFGRGSGHPAGLNFGDCFAYALAKASGERSMFKGTDFAATDIEPYD